MDDISFIDSSNDEPIEKRELKINEEYLFKFSNDDDVYALTGQCLNVLVITYL